MFPDFTALTKQEPCRNSVSPTRSSRTVCLLCISVPLQKSCHAAVNGTHCFGLYVYQAERLFRRLCLPASPGLFSFRLGGLHTELCCRSLFLLAFFCGTWTLGHFVPKCRKPPARTAPVRAWANAASSLAIRFSFHSSYPPGGSSAGHRFLREGTHPQTEWLHFHRTTAPRRNCCV